LTIANSKLLYHVTSPTFAQNMVDRKASIEPVGKGEFGKGFYTAYYHLSDR